jgi:hypothetical protein
MSRGEDVALIRDGTRLLASTPGSIPHPDVTKGSWRSEGLLGHSREASLAVQERLFHQAIRQRSYDERCPKVDDESVDPEVIRRQ